MTALTLESLYHRLHSWHLLSPAVRSQASDLGLPDLRCKELLWSHHIYVVPGKHVFEIISPICKERYPKSIVPKCLIPFIEVENLTTRRTYIPFLTASIITGASLPISPGDGLKVAGLHIMPGKRDFLVRISPIICSCFSLYLVHRVLSHPLKRMRLGHERRYADTYLNTTLFAPGAFCRPAPTPSLDICAIPSKSSNVSVWKSQIEVELHRSIQIRMPPGQ